MSAGRPPDGLKHVERLEGPEDLKHRLRVVLGTLTGECTLAEACVQLELSEARVHELRRQVLEAALAGLVPQAAGRPAREKPEDTSREELEREVRELRIELQAARVRTEIALTMPQLLERGLRKKNSMRPKTKTHRHR